MTKNDSTGLGRRLKVARMLVGLEQADMAAQLGVARTTVSAWEIGRTEPSASHFAAWSQLTGQTMDWLAGRPGATSDPTPEPDTGAMLHQPHGALAFLSA